MTRKEIEKLTNEEMIILRKRLVKKLKSGYMTQFRRNETSKYMASLFEAAYGLGRKDGENKAWSAWNSNFADNGWMDHTCAKCGYTINTDVHVSVDYDFCPGCGSPMLNGRTFSEQYSNQKELDPISFRYPNEQ